MAIRDEILTLKNKEGTLAGNKVCNFAYDDTAFEDDTTTGANGVTTYNYNNHNNIPVKDPTVLKTNPTIISKGFRSQVSVLPRMLLNHIFGRVSYNLNKTVDTFNSLLSNLYNYIGQPNGLATLDNTGRLPYSQLSLSAVEYKGAWNASTNTPTLASGTGTFGDEYIVSTQGTQNLGEGSITYRVGDRVIYNGSIWQRIPASSVRTVNLKTPDANGNVTVNASDMVTPDVYGYDRRDVGIVWTGSDAPHDAYFALYYAEGLWVAGGENGFYWSVNGRNWTHSSSNGIHIVTVCYANGIWVAGGSPSQMIYSNLIYWSTDGKNWTQGTSSGLVNINDVYYANGLWVAVGRGGTGNVFWSTDGKNWTQGTGLPSGTFTGNKVYYANGIWELVSSTSGIYWSTDGKAWTRGTGTSGYFMSIYYANGIWVAGGSNANGIYWSTDGKAWTQGTGLASISKTSCVYYANGLWVAGVFEEYSASDRKNVIYWSTDGKTWTQGTQTISVNDTSSFNTFYYAQGIWMAGSYDWAYKSLDGKTWQATGSVSSVFRILYADGVWALTEASSFGRICYSIGSPTNNVAQILDWLLYAVDNLLN